MWFLRFRIGCNGSTLSFENENKIYLFIQPYLRKIHIIFWGYCVKCRPHLNTFFSWAVALMKRHHKPRVNYWSLPNWYGFSLEMRETRVTDSWHAITRCHNHSMLSVLPVILWSMWRSMKNPISSQFPQCLLMFNSLSLEWEILWQSMGKLMKEPGYILNQRVEKLHSKPARDVIEMLYIYIKISCCLIKKLVIFT